MTRFDYHLHTAHSMDGHMTMDALCQAALSAGLSEICVTEHTEFGHPDAACDRPPDIPLWLSDLARAREAYPTLVIRAGIEIGDNPRCRARIQAWHAALPLDFRLLSLHLVDDRDPYYPSTFEGITQAVLYRRYAECQLESLLAWPPDQYDALAHLGFCAKFAPYPVSERPLRLRHAPEALDAIFRHLAMNGKALEINTSGIRLLGECIPGRELLERFRALGGEFVTLGSDAHLPGHVGGWIGHAADLGRRCGFRYALTFDRQKPVPVRL